MKRRRSGRSLLRAHQIFPAALNTFARMNPYVATDQNATNRDKGCHNAISKMTGKFPEGINLS